MNCKDCLALILGEGVTFDECEGNEGEVVFSSHHLPAVIRNNNVISESV